ncbi:L-aspartate oxidase [Desulfacinum hydrothermale DSM 13146]|uniref:L-aspartate oxidase n=1 Tax=Desulfacinum hydrothermale DSM 13146 TaxID=1121390 RepID=A0A1W1XGK3_9BACT|nr:L-aspartate oxidase [Desulfacinum hydrothermale]SMC23136.1 L-aspartate oxidase [Desulfacinum hydrothermale DSM 13146]
MEHRFDFLVIGSGIAGLTFALKVAEHATVAIVTKKDKLETSTNYAQGGIASALGPDDSFQLHIEDTLTAGDGLSKPEVVELVVRSAPERIHELAQVGVPFSPGRSQACPFDLGREGGHSRNRIVHAEDMTGQAIERVLINAAESHPNVSIFENHLALDLIIQHDAIRVGSIPVEQRQLCWGAYVLDAKNGTVHTFIAHATLLCTGGAGKVYLYTSNPDVATGDGLAMAYRAGARLANLEFVQFHPTCLYHPHAKNFLISEAVRGEGGRLIDKRGNAFMERYHPLKDLAFRDVVARAIDTEMKRTGDDCVYLDISHRDADFLKRRFPNIYKKCLSLGIDITKDPIPVVPAAHYMCGGIATDLWAQSSIANLYAIGECACTGLHGANRLASNSLLEAAVFSHRGALHCIENIPAWRQRAFPEIPAWPMELSAGNGSQSEMILISHNWDVIRRLMWNYVGIVRTDKRLKLASRHIAQIRMEIREHLPNIPLHTDLVELQNLVLVAELIVRCALTRKESRGLHYNLDHPQKDDPNWKKDTLIARWKEPRIPMLGVPHGLEDGA